jgi:hypothetical protein
MEWWSDGGVEWWRGGVMEGWSDGGVEWWSGGVVEWWRGGGVEGWSAPQYSSRTIGRRGNFLVVVGIG